MFLKLFGSSYKILVLNLIWFEKFGFHGYWFNLKVHIIKQGVSDSPGNDRKMTPHSNFKVRFFEKPLDVVGGLLFQFGVLWKVWLHVENS